MGNPSDGYQGKTLSIIVGDCRAQVTLYEWDQVEIVLSQEDRSAFRSIEELARDVRLHGYYGGIRLVKATIKKFVDYCHRQGHELHDRNFSVRYESNIPRQVGMAGSSAIIVATLKCLMEFYGIDVPQAVRPSLALSVETDELGIAAGLQDRVIQVFGGLVFMDFSPESAAIVDGFECGYYEPIDPARLPPLYLAYRTDVSEPTEVLHNDLRLRYRRGEADVVGAMRQFADLTVQARGAILEGDAVRLARLIDANFDLRRSICKIPAAQSEMVDTARRCGASAKFAGSGGAIVGTYPDRAVLDRLRAELSQIGCRVIRPTIEPREECDG